VITGNEVTAISGIGGAIVGALLTWFGGWQAQRGQDNSRRTELRREAYAGLIGALDRLQRLWESPETLAIPDGQKVPAATAEAVGRIQDAYGTVRLVGSKDARAKARAAWSAAWDVSNRLNNPRKTGLNLGQVIEAFTAAAQEFLKQAETEVVP
jgi:hypothetical protein